jgi:flavin-dependent thymidylate synthase
MEVILAGYNVDRELLTGSPPPDPEALTPETLSAAYARVSRDPRPIPELRADARQDVVRARRSNRQIVFGFGHASVAEHAVFNLDVLGVSRVALEALEATRLGSYTEKSQRYIRLEDDFALPAEIAEAGLAEPFRRLVRAQQEAYRRAHEVLESRAGAETAHEDARYCLGLSATGQVGVTLNARSLEATVRRLAADPRAEVRELSGALHAAVAGVAPSLVRYTEPTPLRAETPDCLAALLHAWGADAPQPSDAPDGPVRLIAVTPEAEERVLAALVHGCTAVSFADALDRVRRLSPDRRRALGEESLRRLAAHEAPLRAFELADVAFEIALSASAFAQLKRHRMATLLPQAYDPRLGVTVPPSFEAAGLADLLRQVAAASAALHAEIAGRAPAAAVYALTNAHRRRVLFQANVRELYQLARLRLDPHAQWDIRHLAEEMIAQARERLPLLLMLAAGREDFERARREALDAPPANGSSGSTP